MARPRKPKLKPSKPVRITSEDVRKAKEAWRRDAPPMFKRLLDAKLR
jgi:hypothetical protein